jgi:nicotinate-nucleotide pyrophosphorylase (carboxylating)
VTSGHGAPKRSPGLTAEARGTLARALAEDRVLRDATTRGLFARPIPAVGTAIVQRDAVLSGVEAGAWVARRMGLRARPRARDGERVRAGRAVLVLTGDARRILAAERTVLNVLMHLSGVATSAARAVEALRPGRSARPSVYATRKTLPGLRDLEKRAVADGGGEPHRRDLASGVLVKNNHLVFVSIPEAVRRLRSAYGAGRPIQVEVRSARDAIRAIEAGADALLIDNASPSRASAIVRRVRSESPRRRIWIEVSGGITPRTVARYRSSGADSASLGALTHSAPAIPFHLAIRPARGREGRNL